MYTYTLSRPSPDNLSLLQYSSLMSILAVYLFYLAFDPGHLKHTVLTEKRKLLTLFFVCLTHSGLVPPSLCWLRSRVWRRGRWRQRMSSGPGRNWERSWRPSNRPWTTTTGGAGDRGWSVLGLHYYYWPHYFIIGLRVQNAPWKESDDQPRQHIKKRRHYFANKGPSSQG